MKYLYTLLFILLSPYTMADELRSLGDVRSLTKNVMNLVENGESLKGVQLIKPYLTVPETEFDLLLANLRQQKPVMDRRFGKTVGIEFISEQSIGKSLIKITYIQKFQQHAMRWMFYYYKPKDTWVMSTFKTDDDIKLLF